MIINNGTGRCPNCQVAQKIIADGKARYRSTPFRKDKLVWPPVVARVGIDHEIIFNIDIGTLSFMESQEIHSRGSGKLHGVVIDFNVVDTGLLRPYDFTGVAIRKVVKSVVMDRPVGYISWAPVRNAIRSTIKPVIINFSIIDTQFDSIPMPAGACQEVKSIVVNTN